MNSKYPGGVVIGKFAGEKTILRLPVGKKGLACHSMAFGASGSGKTYGFVLPNIVSAVADGSSIVVSDPKGELVAGKYNREGKYEPGIAGWLLDQGYEVRVLNFISPEQGTHRWNLIMEPRNDDEFLQLSSAMIESVETGRSDQVFFKAGEISVLTAFMGMTRYNSWFTDEQRHMRTALSMLNWDVSNLNDAFERELQKGTLPPVFYERWKGASANFDNFKAGITGKLSTVMQGSMALVTSQNDFELEEVANKKIALFLVFPTMGDLRPVLTGFYFLLFKRLVELASKCRGSLPVPVRFILDEFANIGKIPSFTQRVTFDRGLGITYIMIVQALSQLISTYGRDEANTILNSCDIQMALRINDSDTAQLFSRKMGLARVKKITHTKDVSLPGRQWLPKRTEVIEQLPVMYDWQFSQLPFYTAVALIPTCRPLFLDTVAFHELREFKNIPHEVKTIGDYAPAPPPKIPLPALNGARDETRATESDGNNNNDGNNQQISTTDTCTSIPTTL